MNDVSQIYFHTDNVIFRKALFEKYGIRNCAVRLNRVEEKDFPKVRPKLSINPTGTVRSNSKISWFPGTLAVQEKSTDALSSLVAYQTQNGIGGQREYFSLLFYLNILRLGKNLI